MEYASGLGHPASPSDAPPCAEVGGAEPSRRNRRGHETRGVQTEDVAWHAMRLGAAGGRCYLALGSDAFLDGPSWSKTAGSFMMILRRA